MNCYNNLNTACSQKAHEELFLSFEKTQNCVKKSFSSENWQDPALTNHIIDEELQYWKHYGSGIYPSIVINNRTYRGQLEKLSVYNAICAGFQNPPKICEQTKGYFVPGALPDEIKFPTDYGVSPQTIILLVIFVIALNIIVVYCYRRYSRREMQNEMQMKIESAVNQYFALSQNSNKPYLK